MVAQLVKNLSAIQDPSSIPGLGRSTRKEIGCPLQYSWASLVAQLVKNLHAMWETWVQSLAWEDTLKKGIATHSSIENDESQVPCPSYPVCKRLPGSRALALNHSST